MTDKPDVFLNQKRNAKGETILDPIAERLEATQIALWQLASVVSDWQADVIVDRLYELSEFYRLYYEEEGVNPVDGIVEIADEFEFIGMRLPHRLRIARQVKSGWSNDQFDHPARLMCIKCEKFPEDDDSPCPHCQSTRWMVYYMVEESSDSE